MYIFNRSTAGYNRNNPNNRGETVANGKIYVNRLSKIEAKDADSATDRLGRVLLAGAAIMNQDTLSRE